MKLFDVYPLFPITPANAQGSWLWDTEGKKYLDLYGGHAVISIGHSHPHYVEALTKQQQAQQAQLAQKKAEQQAAQNQAAQTVHAADSQTG